MAKIKGNPSLIAAISGAIGGLVYVTDRDGNISLRRLPERKPRRKSAAREAYEGKFLAAIAYGNMVKADPLLAPLYQLVCTGRMSPYQAGLRDFLTPPVVEGLGLADYTGRPGSTIRVAASDDFQVIQLTVMIRDATNQEILEQGPAEWAPLQRKWVYTAQREIPSGTAIAVEATATDRPGNQGAARVLHLVS